MSTEPTRPGSLLGSGGSHARIGRWGWALITVAVLLTYWPLSSFQFTVTHGDTLNCWLPWRWTISACLQDGHFPLWNPHQQFGYPLHADLQGPSWCVEALAVGGTVGHSIYTLQLLFLAYCIIGGIGCMRLVRAVHNDDRSALVMGLAYALGGFFNGHQMHFYTVISAAWLPWLFDAAIRLLRDPGWRPAASLALFQGLLLTGGNHTFTILSSYVLLALGIAHLWKQWPTGGWPGARRMIGWSLLAVLGACAIGAGPLYSWWETGPLLSRSSGLAYEAAAAEPVTWRSLISLFFPYAIGNNATRLGTDIPMGNVYMGALITLLAISALFRRRNLIENLFLVVGAIAALAAFGDALPVHRVLWAYMPGMDLFRFPAYFRWFTWIAALLLSAGSLQVLWSDERFGRRVFWLFSFGALIAVTLLVRAAGFENSGTSGSSLFERMVAMPLDRRVWFCGAITLPVLLIAASRTWRGKAGFIAILLLVIVEMGWNTSFAQWNTAVSDIEPAWLHKRLSSLTEGPAIPEALPTVQYDDNGGRLHYLIHNAQNFLGGFSRNGVNTFWLKNAMSLELEHPALWNAMSRQPVAYLADRIEPWSNYRADEVVSERDSGLVVLASGMPVLSAVPATDIDRIVISGFAHDAFSIKSNTLRDALLVLQQSHYPGWDVQVDGEKQELLQVNIAAMAVEVPAGSHTIEFRYRKPAVPWLLALSLLTFFALLFGLAFTNGAITAKSAAVVLLTTVGWSLFAHSPKAQRLPKALDHFLPELPNGAMVVLNDDGHADAYTENPNTINWRIRADRPEQAWEAQRVMALAEGQDLYWIDAGLRTAPAVRACIADQYDVLSEKRNRGVDMVHLRLRNEPQPSRMINADTDTAYHWLHGADSFVRAVEFDMNPDDRTGTLVMDLECTAKHGAQAVLVVERKNGDTTTDYRALPAIVGAENKYPIAVYATVPMAELWRPGETLKVYLWSHQGDSIAHRKLRVRVVPRQFHHW